MDNLTLISLMHIRFHLNLNPKTYRVGHLDPESPKIRVKSSNIDFVPNMGFEMLPCRKQRHLVSGGKTLYFVCSKKIYTSS